MSSPTLIHLPEESLCWIARFLSPPDVLNFISIHPTFVPVLCHSKQFWSYLNHVHYGKSSDDTTGINNEESNLTGDWNKEKLRYLLKSYCNTLSNVRWYSIDSQVRCGSVHMDEIPSAREGHASCIIGNYLVLTGGFTDDDAIYIKHLHHFNEGTSWKRISLEPVGRRNPKNWVYGATLTSFTDTTAIMFGGFQSGGYSNETSQVAILHIEESFGNALSGEARNPAVRAWWEIVECRIYNDVDCASTLSKGLDSNEPFARIAARAYHSATLLFDRYLLIVGGMQSRGSILNPILLDCHSWTWYIDGITSSNMKPTSDVTMGTSSQSCPSSRHGCSMVADLDSNRNRLVLFGGSSGHDLLRSGTENTEVWGLSLNGCQSAKDVITSLPWTWNILHRDQSPNLDEDDNDSSSGMNIDVDNNNDEIVPNPNYLSPVERCNLGRCHGGYRVGRDVVLLAFGYAQVTTNSILCYDLKHDNFFRTRVHPSFIPRGRFTFASTFVESKGIVIFHGGYSSHPEGDALSDTLLLDLAPAMNPHAQNGRLWLPISHRVMSYSITTDSIVNEIVDERANRTSDRNPFMAFSFFFSQLMGESPEQQRVISLEMLSTMDDSQRSGRMGGIVRLFAVGHLHFGDSGSLISHNLDPDGEDLLNFFM